jgi:hypothetical protein
MHPRRMTARSWSEVGAEELGMPFGTLIDDSAPADRVETLGYLQCRIREEAEAAVRAVSLEATLAHVQLATSYAHRIREHSGRDTARADRSWADRHRVW